MLLWLLGEVVVGLLISGLVLALAVPAAMSLGYETGPIHGVVVTLCALAASVVFGERLRKRRRARQSP